MLFSQFIQIDRFHIQQESSRGLPFRLFEVAHKSCSLELRSVNRPTGHYRKKGFCPDSRQYIRNTQFDLQPVWMSALFYYANSAEIILDCDPISGTSGVRFESSFTST
jgi:hypothetical protein